MAGAQSRNEAFAFPCLDATNYATWSLRMESLLVLEELWHVVSENAPDPVTDAWKAADQRARAMITLGVSDAQLINLQDKQTAKQMWDALRDIHLRTDAWSSLVYFTKLSRMQLQPGGDLEAHLMQMKFLREELNKRGMNISDDIFCLMIINSLDASFDSVVSQLSVLSAEQLTLDHVGGVLLNEMDRRVAINHSQERASNVPKPSAQSLDGDTALQAQRCFNCGELGHLQKSCNKGNKFKRGSRERGGGKFRSSFVIGSGAGHHLCKDKSLFIQLKMQEGMTYLAGVGLLQSKGEGTVFLNSLNTTIKNVLYVPHLAYNILSVSQLTSQGFSVRFAKNKCEIIKGNEVILFGKFEKGVFLLP